MPNRKPSDGRSELFLVLTRYSWLAFAPLIAILLQRSG